MNRDTCEKLLAAYRTAVKNDEDAIAKMLFEAIVDVMSGTSYTLGTFTNPLKVTTPLKVTPSQPYDDSGNWTVVCTGVDALSDVMGCEG